jgi:hypothetical protein
MIQHAHRRAHRRLIGNHGKGREDPAVAASRDGRLGQRFAGFA